MASEINAYCAVCGKGYHVCRSCGDVMTFKPWRSIADSINCYQVYLAIWSYDNEKITKSEARDMLSRCNLDEYKTYTPEYIKIIEDIMDTDQGKSSAKRTAKQAVCTKKDDVLLNESAIQDVSKNTDDE